MRGALSIAAALVIGALSLAPFACSASGPPACSDGPARAKLDQITITRTSNDVCTPRCAFSQSRPMWPWPLEAVPSGACDRDEYICGMQVDDGCTTHGVQCECRDGEWQCGITSPGAGVCLDAGPARPRRVPKCSNGLPRVLLEHLPEKSPNDICIPRCEFSPTKGVYPIEAVPSGSCEENFTGYVCNMFVIDGCATDEVQCECRDDEWLCGIVRLGTGECTDAGDAGDAD
jgi:hypothetical protein